MEENEDKIPRVYKTDKIDHGYVAIHEGWLKYLVNRVKRLEQTLEFYATESNYGGERDNGYSCSCCSYSWYEEGEVEDDKGKRAREVLGLE